MHFLELSKTWVLANDNDILYYFGFFALASLISLITYLFINKIRYHHCIGKLIEEMEGNYNLLEKINLSPFYVVKDRVYNDVKHKIKVIPESLMAKINLIYDNCKLAEEIGKRCHGIDICINLSQERLQIKTIISNLKDEMVYVKNSLNNLPIKHSTFRGWRLRMGA
jgi:hypothetical protein